MGRRPKIAKPFDRVFGAFSAVMHGPGTKELTTSFLILHLGNSSTCPATTTTIFMMATNFS